MELLQLRYFAESAETENFSQVAARYMVPPSAVSLSIKRLERELGVELFRRGGNRVRLSPAGRTLWAAVSSALETLDSAVEMLGNAAQDLSGDVRLLIRCNRNVVTRYLTAFREQSPGVIFYVSHQFGRDAGTEHDLIVDDDAADYPGYEKLPLMEEKLHFAVAADSPLCGRKLTMRQLRDEPFLTMTEGASLHRLTVQACRAAGFEPQITIACDDPYYLRRYVASGFGVALIPEKSWQGKIGADITRLDLAEPAIRRQVCLYRRARHCSAAARAFGDYLAAQIQAIGE